MCLIGISTKGPEIKQKSNDGMRCVAAQQGEPLGICALSHFCGVYCQMRVAGEGMGHAYERRRSIS